MNGQALFGIHLSGLPFLFLLGFILLANRHLFTQPQVDWGDLAANALQVQNAEHFHELLGNYSRWQFHHPGPFFFYLFAAGEGLFYHLLHLVPAPLNAEYLAEAVFSVYILYLVQRVLSAHVRSAVFLPLSMLAIILFLSVVGHAIPGSAIVSLWPPFMAIFVFLLLAIACASVAAGRWADVPLMVFAAGVMIHAHVAQVLFTTCLVGAALAIAFAAEMRSGTLARSLLQNRRRLVWAAVIAVLFALPILLEAVLHKPNNLHQIRIYLRQYHGQRNSLHVALLYTLSFFTYNTSVDALLARNDWHVKDMFVPDLWVQAYWAIFFLLAATAIAAVWIRRPRIPKFLWLLAAQAALITMLFIYWSRRITGPMYTFNGYFYFSVQLLLLLLLCGCLAPKSPGIRRLTTISAACCFSSLVFLIPGIRVPDSYHPEVSRAAAAIGATHKRAVKLVFDPGSWPDAAGVASTLTREGVSFCVEPQWGFLLSHICKAEVPAGDTFTIGSGPGHEPAFFSQQISSPVKALEVKAGETQTLPIRIKYTGPEPWRGAGRGMTVQVGYRWRDNHGILLPSIEKRADFDLAILPPGESAAVRLPVTAPGTSGSYTLCVSMVQQGVAWFDDKGATPLRISVIVK